MVMVRAGAAAPDPLSYTSAPSSAGDGLYTAVVIVHGMGNSRRYDNLSHLVDTLDMFARAGQDRGEWRHVKPRRFGELKDGAHLYYVRADYSPDGTYEHNLNVRFFEAYWSPKLAGGLPALDVLKWFGQLLPKAFSHLWAPWRSFQRGRIAVLHQLVERGAITESSAQKLATLLEDFSRFSAIKKHRGGTFKQFQTFVCNEVGGSSAILEDLLAWRKAGLIEDWMAALTSVGVIGLLVAVFVFLVTVTASVTSWTLAPFVEPWTFWSGDGTGRKVAQILLGLLLASPIGNFIGNYLGDVAYWGTYDENDTKYEKRRAVLDLCTATFEAIVQDPKCERVVIVAHSLGSRVTYETLLHMNYRRLEHNRNDETSAMGQLRKIKHLITYGSPIDKMHYFMESRSGFSRHYERTYNQLTGDASCMPFKSNRKASVLWVNFFAAGDAISGPIQTPNDLNDFTPMIFNVPVVNYDNINMGKNHTSYFDNQTVVEWLHRVITDARLDRIPGGTVTPPTEQPNALGHQRRAGWMYVGALAFPVVVVTALILGIFGLASAALSAWSLSGIVLIVLLWNMTGPADRHTNPIL